MLKKLQAITLLIICHTILTSAESETRGIDSLYNYISGAPLVVEGDSDIAAL